MTARFRSTRRFTLPAGLAVLLFATPLAAQETAEEWLDRCEQESGRRERVCEVRSFALPATGTFEADARPNGGIRVTAWDRNEVQVIAKLQAQASSTAAARAIADEVAITARPGSVSSDGPRTRRGESWSVSYELRVPRQVDLDLRSTNGGLSVDGVAGTMRLSTTNGGIRLNGVAGDVRGRTVNGGMTVSLDGDRWRGTGLDLQTTNGGVEVRVPDRYSAHLVASTVNGGLNTEMPVTVQGRIGRRIEADLGEGGPTISIRTTNGGVRLERR